MRYTLRQLEVFLTIARCGNLTQAASQLAMSQSAASSALKDLENQFDLQLFDRIGRRLQLNEQGKALQPKAQSLLEQAGEIERMLLNHDDAGHLAIGATLSIGNYLAVGLVAQYKSRYPQADVRLEVNNTHNIVEQIRRFELDVGLIEGEINDSELDIQTWRTDELVVFCSPEHPLANQASLSDEQLVKAQWILRESGSGTRQAFDRAMHGLLPELNVAMELQHTEAIKRAVEAVLGLGCLSRITLEDAFRHGRLIPLAVPHRDFHRSLYRVLHKQKYRSTGLESWLSLCDEMANPFKK